MSHTMRNSFLFISTILLVAGQNTALCDIPRSAYTRSIPESIVFNKGEKRVDNNRARVKTISSPQSKAKSETSPLNVTIGLSSNVQFGAVENNRGEGSGYTNFNKNQEKKRSKGFVTNNKIIFKVEGISEMNVKYGAYLKINADTLRPINSDVSQKPNPVGDKMMLFLEGDLGRLEAGTYDGVHDRIKVSGASVARGADGIGGDWSDWLSSKAYYNYSEGGETEKKSIGSSFIDAASLPVDRDYLRANKITYYTPELNGLTFGISYIPDAEYTGTVDQITRGVATADKGNGYEDVVETGIRYKAKLDQADLTLSTMGEFGRAKKGNYPQANIDAPHHIERNDLLAWEVGAKLDYKGFSVAGSYGDLGKSGTTKNPKPEVASSDYKYGGSYWTAGIGYIHDKLGMSVTYLQSKSAGLVVDQPQKVEQYITGYNKVNVVSLGVDYSVLPGFLPYAEVTHFKYHRAGDNNVKGNSGMVFLVGAKLKF